MLLNHSLKIWSMISYMLGSNLQDVFVHESFAVVDGRQKFKITAAHQLSNAMYTSGWQNFYWLVEFILTRQYVKCMTVTS